jgi:hypothetical protein
MALNPGHTKLRHEIGLMQLAEGDFESGWKALESRWEVKKQSPALMAIASAAESIPKWQGDSLSGKILIVWPEQGLGDSILFVRYLSILAERAQHEDGLILFYCYDHLFTLCARSLAEYCDVLVVSKIVKEIPLQPQQFVGRQVVQFPLASLPLWSGNTIPSKFPYLRPDPIKVKAWRARLSGDTKLKIGISWTGRADHPRNDLRSVSIMELMRRLKDIPDVAFYSLQLDQADQSKAAGLIDFTRDLASFDDTAALMCNLDLIIGIDAVIAHFAGALGNPYLGDRRLKSVLGLGTV